MKLLAIETSETACSAALWDDGDCQEIFDLVPRRHSELLLPMIDQLLSTAGIDKLQLDAIAFGRGPGSFTGIRIATGVAQGLGFALDRPLLPVSTLAGIAQGCYRRLGADSVVAALDARMREIYWGRYQLDAEEKIMRLHGDESCCSPDLLYCSDGRLVGCGSGWQVYAESLQAACGDAITCIDPEPHCHARDIASIAVVDYLQGKGMSAEQALPTYLRNQVAAIPGNS